MKRINAILFVLFFLIQEMHSQDSIHIFKSGLAVFNSEIATIDSITFLKNEIPANLNGIFTDSRDGHVYKTIQIGKQIWMAENLAYLPVTASDRYTGLEDEANRDAKTTSYYYVNNKLKFGVLYNWFAALTASPPGWHLPSESEWVTLRDYLGENCTIAGKLKSKEGWSTAINLTNNTSGFTALPGGYRDQEGWKEVGSMGLWWFISDSTPSLAMFFFLNNLNNCASTSYFENYFAISIRCVKDN